MTERLNTSENGLTPFEIGPAAEELEVRDWKS
jgi:hypothetical protein